MINYKEYLAMREGTKATIYTQSSSKGATVDTSQQDEQPVMLNINDIVNYEPAGKMQEPENQDNMKALVDAIKKGQSSYFFKGHQRQIKPILVRQANNLKGSSGGISNSQYKYQVVDGHHRYWAYKIAGVKEVPAIIIAPENIRKEKVWTPNGELL